MKTTIQGFITMARDLESLSHAILSTEGEHGVIYKSDFARRMRFLNKITSEGGSLAGEATALAPELIKQAMQFENQKSWGPVMVAVAFAKHVLNNADNNPNLSTTQVLDGYTKTLSLMADNSGTLCPTKESYDIVNPLYNAMARRVDEIKQNGDGIREPKKSDHPRIWVHNPIKVV